MADSIAGRLKERWSEKRRSIEGTITVIGVCSALLAGAVMGGCAAHRQQTLNTDDYVEIDNPFIGDTAGENPKIWVPRKSVEKGVPRGGELLKKGYEALAGKPDPKSGAIVDAGAPPSTDHVRLRLLVAEDGEQVVGVSISRFLGRSCIVRALARPSAKSLASEQDQLDFITPLAAQPVGGPVLILSKPEGIKPGSRIKADLYDIRGPILIRSFFVKVPAPAKDQTPDDALNAALKGLADAALGSLEWLAWYGRVIDVSGERVYIDAGAESGLKPGQRVTVYRGGEAIKGIGFAPGERITNFTLTERVGPDGAYGTTVDATRVQPGDYVEIEKQ